MTHNCRILNIFQPDNKPFHHSKTEHHARIPKSRMQHHVVHSISSKQKCCPLNALVNIIRHSAKAKKYLTHECYSRNQIESSEWIEEPVYDIMLPLLWNIFHQRKQNGHRTTCYCGSESRGSPETLLHCRWKCPVPGSEV